MDGERDDDRGNDDGAQHFAQAHGPGTAAFASSPALGLPDKPMVPTAPTSPAANPPRPWRQQIGPSLGSRDGAVDIGPPIPMSTT